MSIRDDQRWLELLQQASILKTTPRTGWHLRGVPQPESVADHSYATAMVALVLSAMADLPVDREKLLTLALIHDLAESIVGDIPRRGGRLLPPGAKETAETAALDVLVADLPVATPWADLMREYKENRTIEARLVHDADQLEFGLQARQYRWTTGNRHLDDVRASLESATFATGAAERLRDVLLAGWD